VAVDESLVDAAVDDYADQMGAGAAAPWRAAVHDAATRRRAELVQRVAEVSRSAVAGTAPPAWARALGVLPVLLVLGAIGAVGWQLVGAPPDVAGGPAGWLTAAALGGLAVVLAAVGGWVAAAAARHRVERNARTTRGLVADAVDAEAVGPVTAEVAAYAAWCEGLASARAA
jgi:hypothetical protein